MHGGGGVALFIKNNIGFVNQEQVFNQFNEEIVIVSIYIRNKELLVLSYYNPKKLSKEVFNFLTNIKKRFYSYGRFKRQNDQLW